jgi:hypothetical protein
MPSLTDLMVVNTRASAPLDANAPGDAQTSGQVSSFVTVQSLSTFTVAAAVLKTLWELTKSLFGAGWAESYWTPFVLCLLYGAWQLAISFSSDGARNPMQRVSAGVIALSNSAILAASVIGLTETTQ